MFKAIVRFFRGPSVDEAYQNGRKCVDEALANAQDQQDEAQHLYHLASGGFNSKPYHYAFDSGVKDRLDELGYPSPY